MTKQAVSVTLSRDNVLWLRGQARTTRRGSVSEALDRLVAEARARGQVHEGSIRSVVGTVRIAAADPELTGADAVIRVLLSPGRGPRPRVRRARANRSRSRA
jgi:hypothetical protein